MKTIENYLTSSEIHEYKIIPASGLPFSEAVVDACKANRCGKYGTCWTCPPGVGNLRDNEKRIKSYKNAAVMSFRYFLEDSFDFEGMTQGQKKAKTAFRKIIEALQCDGVNFLALGCEGCGLCEKCTYPDATCRFPEQAIPSVEALGIDVVKLAKITGLRYNNGENTVTYFCVIVFGG